MARKRRGRPPKKRGPGRPKGSRNKSKSVVASAALDDMHERLKFLEKRMVPAATFREAEDLASVVRSLIEQVADADKRLEKLTTAFNDLVADAEHPTTQILARRLLAIESDDKITRTVHERLNRIETEIRSFRATVGEIAAERAAERNRSEVAKLAETDDNAA